MRTRSAIERKGINVVEEMVLSELNWIFREQPIEDFGIDAHIEVCDGNEPTGRIIAAQIKSGDSYFSEENERGWVFRGESRHLNYWTSHSLPVILILCQPESRKAWWVPIQSSLFESTGVGWKIIVPRSFQFDMSATEHLLPIAIPDFNNRRDISAVLMDPTKLGVFPSGEPSESKTVAAIAHSFGGIEGLLYALNSAQRSIDIALPCIDTEMFWVLKTLSFRVQIRLVISPITTDEVSIELRKWTEEAPNMETRVFNGCLHTKLIVIDGCIAIYGSANLTRHAWRSDVESVLATDDPKSVERNRHHFQQLWNSELGVLS